MLVIINLIFTINRFQIFATCLKKMEIACSPDCVEQGETHKPCFLCYLFACESFSHAHFHGQK